MRLRVYVYKKGVINLPGEKKEVKMRGEEEEGGISAKGKKVEAVRKER